MVYLKMVDRVIYEPKTYIVTGFEGKVEEFDSFSSALKFDRLEKRKTNYKELEDFLNSSTNCSKEAITDVVSELQKLKFFKKEELLTLIRKIVYH